MARFRLIAGRHYQADPDFRIEGKSKRWAEMSVSERLEAREHGVKPPSREYTRGSIIEADVDLVAKHGSNKFLRIGGGETLASAVTPAGPSIAAPGGQVSSGFQSATGTPEGTISGPAEEKHELHEEGGEVVEAPQSWKGQPTVYDPRDHERSKEQIHHHVQRDLDKMSVNDLKSLAAEEEIDLTGADTKREMVAKIRAKQ